MRPEAQAGIDELLRSWDRWDRFERYYLSELAPAIVCGQAPLGHNETKIVAELRRTLSASEWRNLPTLLAKGRQEQQLERELEIQRQQEREWLEAVRLEEEAAKGSARKRCCNGSIPRSRLTS